MKSIYIYVFDSLRYDYVGGELTPNFNKLAGHGIFFTNGISQATWSNPAAMAILTGLYPTAVANFGEIDSKIRTINIKFPVTVDILPAAFQRAGFFTVAYSTNVFFSDEYGMQRGFSSMPKLYDFPELAQRAEISKKVSKRLERNRELLLPLVTGKDLNNVMWSHREEYASEEKRLHLVWSMDTHSPFYDRNRVDELALDDIEIVNRLTDDVERSQALYRDMVTYADAQFGEFIEDLKQRGEYDDSFIIVVGDHGESFGENHQLSHGALPFEEQIHIPYIVKLPGNEYGGQRNDALVGLIDIFPTLADYYAVPFKQQVDGQSIMPAIRGESDGHEYLMVFDQTQDNMWFYGALRSKKAKLVFRTINREVATELPPAPTREMPFKKKLHHFYQHPSHILWAYLPALMFKKQSWVFDLEHDPGEQKNIVFRPQGLVLWIKLLREFGKRRKAATSFFKANVRSVQLTHMNKAIEQRLRDLGYLE
ncbi:MAG: sulfatase [Chloroflexi bacterium]|nr:sulfatase [Chloroflexota bacterium]